MGMTSDDPERGAGILLQIDRMVSKPAEPSAQRFVAAKRDALMPFAAVAGGVIAIALCAALSFAALDRLVGATAADPYEYTAGEGNVLHQYRQELEHRARQKDAEVLVVLRQLEDLQKENADLAAVTDHALSARQADIRGEIDARLAQEKAALEASSAAACRRAGAPRCAEGATRGGIAGRAGAPAPGDRKHGDRPAQPPGRGHVGRARGARAPQRRGRAPRPRGAQGRRSGRSGGAGAGLRARGRLRFPVDPGPHRAPGLSGRRRSRDAGPQDARRPPRRRLAGGAGAPGDRPGHRVRPRPVRGRPCSRGPRAGGPGGPDGRPRRPGHGEDRSHRDVHRRAGVARGSCCASAVRIPSRARRS